MFSNLAIFFHNCLCTRRMNVKSEQHDYITLTGTGRNLVKPIVFDYIGVSPGRVYAGAEQNHVPSVHAMIMSNAIPSP